MTNQNESQGAKPRDDASTNDATIGESMAEESNAAENQPSWAWLQERILASSTAPFDNWLSGQLTLLEEDYAEMVTVDSRNRELRREFGRDRDAS